MHPQESRNAAIEAAQDTLAECREGQTIPPKPPTPSGEGSVAATCSVVAVIWIHTHHETGKPLQIHASWWQGETHFMDVLYNEDVRDIMNILEALPLEADVKVKIEFQECDDWGVYDISLLPNA